MAPLLPGGMLLGQLREVYSETNVAPPMTAPLLPGRILLGQLREVNRGEETDAVHDELRTLADSLTTAHAPSDGLLELGALPKPVLRALCASSLPRLLRATLGISRPSHKLWCCGGGKCCATASLVGCGTCGNDGVGGAKTKLQEAVCQLAFIIKERGLNGDAEGD